MTGKIKSVHLTTRAEWRCWLRENHTCESEVLIVYYKAHTGKPSISYQDALEEALCFGWIDGQVRRIDEDRYSQRWTPRRAGSRWSDVNRKLARKLIRAKRMTKAGREAFEAGLTRPPSKRAGPIAPTIPKDLERALRRNKRAWANFQALAPTYRKRYLRWITGAKRDETRQRRIAEAVRLAADGVKVIMK